MQKYKFKKGDYVSAKGFKTPNDLYQVTTRHRNNKLSITLVYGRQKYALYSGKNTLFVRYDSANFVHAPLELYLAYLKSKQTSGG